MHNRAADNSAQAEYWNTAPGRKWLDHQEVLDALLAPALEVLLVHAGLVPGERVLDIGCGTGASSLAAALAVGSEGRVEGVDIAAELLSRAAERAASAGLGNLRFTLADAAVHPFPPAGHDALISRFGAMFFTDPVAAFANLARALRPGARVVLVAWAELARNPWFALPRDAAERRLGPAPADDPVAPGPMAFQDRARVAGLLEAAGFRDVSAEAATAALTPRGDMGEVARFMTRVGPASALLRHYDGTDEDAAAIAADCERAVAAFVTPAGLRIPAVLNVFAARWP
jgi:SAM-dependent methyltransferase